MYSSLLLQFRKLSHLRTFVAMQEMSRFTRFGSQKKTVNLGFRAKKTEFPALELTLIFPSNFGIRNHKLKQFYLPADRTGCILFAHCARYFHLQLQILYCKRRERVNWNKYECFRQYQSPWECLQYFLWP